MFFTLWSLLVYAPLAHWVWSPTGWLAVLGVADFAGGTVVEVNCGVTGLVCALMLGRRIGYGSENLAPWNLSYAVIGASLLWVGWMGFNSGGALGANGRAGMAVLVTQIAAAGATLAWSFAEWFLRGKPSVLGAISGAVAGLVAITPAAGFVLPGPALMIGIAAGCVCFWASTSLKLALRYDDSLDAFGVHGIGGIIGTLATGWFAYGPLSATAGDPGGVYTRRVAATHRATDRGGRDDRLCRLRQLGAAQRDRPGDRPTGHQRRRARGPRHRAARRAGVLIADRTPVEAAARRVPVRPPRPCRAASPAGAPARRRTDSLGQEPHPRPDPSPPAHRASASGPNPDRSRSTPSTSLPSGSVPPPSRSCPAISASITSTVMLEPISGAARRCRSGAQADAPDQGRDARRRCW